jgi:exodeoxyribonuclease V gamma subunit
VIHLVYAQRTEALLQALAERVREELAGETGPLAPVEVVVPNRNMEQLVRLGLAERLGVAANLRFRRLERFTGELAAAASPGSRLLDADAMTGGILAVLHDETALAATELQPVRDYLRAPDADGTDLRRVQLAERLGRLFEEYAYSRPELIAGWAAGEPTPGDTAEGGRAALAAWQRALWLRVAGPRGLLAAGGAGRERGWIGLPDLLAGAPPLPAGPPLHVFGVSYFARAFAALFARLAATRPVWLFTLNPCMEFWEDVESPAELRRRLARTRAAARRGTSLGTGTRPLPTPGDDPYGLFQDTGNLPLRLWGRPGREHVMLLNELSDCDFTARFGNPAETPPTLLAALQRDVLVREPTPARPTRLREPDGTVRVLACPDLRREVEVVADAIWQMVGAPPLLPDSPPLTFSDVAVMVNAPARDRYLPLLQAAFAEQHGIPCTIADQPLASARATAEAARLLLELPFGRRSRAELLRLMLHPAVQGAGDEASPEEWAALADELGIYFGASREDLAETYVEEDLLSWDQGLRRLALGAFLAGPRSGEARLWRADGREALPADLPVSRLAGAGRFALLARSLLADADHVRGARRPLAAWAEELRRYLGGYLLPPAGEEGDLTRCLAALAELERLDVAGTEVSGRVACALATDAIGALGTGGGGWLAEGVAVSTLLPMRAIPFRVLFLLGLGEGEFPAANRRDALDLRAGGRLAGDVTPAERDRYLFLEALLCARERIVLSYVARDERTGETLRPSGVVQELLAVLARSYLGDPGVAALLETVPSRRWDPAYHSDLHPHDGAARAVPAPATAPGARQEAAAARLGDELLRPLGVTHPVALAELPRRLQEPESLSAVRRLLVLPELPAIADQAATAIHAVPLRTLRAFLECPLQSSAGAVLGLNRDDDEDPARVEDESFRTSRRDETMLLRDAMALAVRRGVTPEEPYRALARRRELAGQMPTGVLGEVERELHVELLVAWHASIADLLAEGGGERLRVGRVPEHEEVDTILPALPLGDGTTGPCELHGRSELLVARRRATVICDPGAPKEGREERVRLLRIALRGFADHLLLAAGGLLAGARREVVLLRRGADGPRQERFALEPIDGPTARTYLAALAAELLAGVHPYLLPCEAVLEAWIDGGEALPLDPAAVTAEVRELASNERAVFSSLWGPVPEPRLYPPLAPEALGAALARRWDPYLGRLTGSRW